MKNLAIAIGAVILLLFPFISYAQSEQTAIQVPPVEQNLVPEGYFALRLVTALKMGTAETEAEAEDMLSSVGVAPRNGWIAAYPVTPDIIGELEKAIMAAADAGKLPVGKDEALKAFQNLTAELGLEVASESSEGYAQAQSEGYAEYPNSTEIDNYYYNVGPPVVTYYPPPWDYYYLYTWVPYPFWFHGFFFGGFFVLHDFHRVVHVHRRVVVVTNHVIHPTTKRVVVIDPVKRMRGGGFRVKRNVSPKERFRSPNARRGAASILGRSRERMGNSNIPSMRKSGTSPSPISERRPERTFLNRKRGSPPASNGRERIARQSISERKATGKRLRTTRPGSVSRRRAGFSERTGKSFSAPSRWFRPPSGGAKRSSSGPRKGGGGWSFQQGRAFGGFR